MTTIRRTPEMRREIEHTLTDRLRALHAEIRRTLSYIGEQVVREARLRGSYTDRTGNLRSSTGYVLAYRGEVIAASAFAETHPTATEGGAKGKSLAETIARRDSRDGYCLVVAAGETYATHLMRRGYDVLQSAETEADRLTALMLRRLNLDK